MTSIDENMRKQLEVRSLQLADMDESGHPAVGFKQERKPMIEEIEWLDDITPVLSSPYLIKGLLDRGAMSVVYGPSNSRKTFFALHLAYQIAAHSIWRDRRVAGGSVFYLAAEGGNGIANRLVALRQADGAENVPFALRRLGLDLLDPMADVQRVIDACKEVSVDTQIGMIVVDTLSRVLAGGDENGPVDMTAFVKNIDRIREATGAHVLVVHHTGKDAARGARGHSSLRAATDTEIEIEVDEKGNRLAKVQKQRDHEGGETFHFDLEAVELGEDQDGDPVQTCLVVDAEPRAARNDTPTMSVCREIQKEIQSRWDGGSPLSMAPQTRPSGRYAPPILASKLGLKAMAVKNLVQSWLDNSILAVEMSDKKLKVTGMRVIEWL